MKITQQQLRDVIAAFTRTKAAYICHASKTFCAWWRHDATRERLHRRAATFKRVTKRTEVLTAHDYGENTEMRSSFSFLFYANSITDRHAVRLQFLHWLLRRYEQRAARRRKQTSTTTASPHEHHATSS